MEREEKEEDEEKEEEMKFPSPMIFPSLRKHLWNDGIVGHALSK